MRTNEPKIEVWRQHLLFPYRGYRRIDIRLPVWRTGRPHHKHVYASWRGARPKAKIPVTEQLATQLFGIKETECDYNYKKPLAGKSKDPGYRMYTKGDITTLECKMCGYVKTYPGKLTPEDLGRVEDKGVHPYNTLAESRRDFAYLRNATWQNGQLAPGPNEGVLLVWVKGIWHRDRQEPQLAARRQYPGAYLLADMGRYLVFQAYREDAES